MTASRSARLVGLGLLVGAVLGACASDDRHEVNLRAVADHAAILCDHLFACCTEGELAELAFVDDKTPPTHDGCIAFHKRTGGDYVAVTEGEETAGRVAVHVERSGDCAVETRALDCRDFHGRILRLHLGDAFSLCNPPIVEPLVADGGPCKLYLDCQSGFCDLPPGAEGDAGADVLGTCKAPPRKGAACPAGNCADDLRCEPETTTCVALVEAGGECIADDACRSGACRGGRCVSPGRCGG